MSRGWLIVFAKAPRPGLVKTRFTPPLSVDQCVEFYEALLADVLEASVGLAASFDLDPILAFHPADAAAEMVHRAPPGFRLHVQRGFGLAERMANAFAEASAGGAHSVLLRGSDSPALGTAHIASALDRLEAGDDVVFTPDAGGGYAMIGMQKPQPRIFDVPMSTTDMLEKSLLLAKTLGLRSSTTRATFDLDTAGDLSALDELTHEESSDLCPRTVKAVLRLRSIGVL